MKNKTSGLWVLMIILGVVLCATTAYASGQPEGASTVPVEEQRLIMMVSSGGSGNTLAAAARKFEEETGIEVETLFFPYQDVRDRQFLALSGGRSTPDIIAVNDEWYEQMYSYLTPLDGLIDQEVINGLMPSLMRDFKRDGSTYMIPVRVGTDIVIYRRDIWDQHGIQPSDVRTWEDFLRVARTVNDPEAGVYAYASQYTPRPYMLDKYSGILYSYNTELLNEDGTRAAFNTPNGIRATKTFVELFQYTPPGAITYSIAEAVEALQTGLAFMNIEYAPRYTVVNDPDFPHYGNFALLPHFPYGEGTGLQTGVPTAPTWSLGINRYSRNQEAAAKFLNFIGSYDEQLRLAVNHSNTPSVLAVYDDPAFVEAVPVASNIKSVLASSRARPLHKDWDRIVDALAAQIERALLGEITVEEALEIAERDVNAVLSRR